MNDNTSKINLAGTLSANINGDDRGKIHFQNSGAQIDGDVEAASLIFEDSHTLSQAVSGEIGGLDIFEIKKAPWFMIRKSAAALPALLSAKVQRLI